MSEIAMITEQTQDSVRVLSVKHWTDRLFSFEVERPSSFKFRSGEFVMIGLLTDEGKPLLRAYSITSPFWDEVIGFYSIKVQDGPLTSRLQHIKKDEFIIMKRKPTGTLVLDALTPARRLFLVSTGTGIAPFASIIRDPESYERFDEIYLIHTCRFADELEYGKSIVSAAQSDMLIGEQAKHQLTYVPSTTRDTNKLTGRLTGRPTDLIRTGRLFDSLAIPALSAQTDRVMICGSLAMNQDMKAICEQAGFVEGANSQPGDFVLEKAFVG